LILNSRRNKKSFKKFDLYLSDMKEASSKVSDRGQVTIPKQMREKLGIEPGMEIDFVFTEGELKLRPHVEDSLDEMRNLREHISFTEEELEDMIEDSRKSWRKLQ